MTLSIFFEFLRFFNFTEEPQAFAITPGPGGGSPLAAFEDHWQQHGEKIHGQVRLAENRWTEEIVVIEIIVDEVRRLEPEIVVGSQIVDEKRHGHANRGRHRSDQGIIGHRFVKRRCVV